MDEIKNKGLVGILNEFTPELIGAVVTGAITYLAFDYLPYHTFEDAARTNKILDYPGEANDIRDSARFYLSALGSLFGLMGWGFAYRVLFKKT